MAIKHILLTAVAVVLMASCNKSDKDVQFTPSVSDWSNKIYSVNRDTLFVYSKEAGNFEEMLIDVPEPESINIIVVHGPMNKDDFKYIEDNFENFK